MEVRVIEERFYPIIKKFLEKHWGSAEIISRGKIHEADNLPGFIILTNNKIIGLLTYNLIQDSCEIVSLNSAKEGKGIATLLINKLKEHLKSTNCKKLWLVTTNDNIKAQEFYKKRGFKIFAVHKNAIEISRKLKPQIPLISLNGIPIKDEIELELIL